MNSSERAAPPSPTWRSMALFATVGALASAPAAAFTWSDTSIHYAYGNDFREPGVTDASGRAAQIAKQIVSLTHSDGYAYGTNFFNVDMLMSNKADPANNGSTGATEFYATYRHQLSLNAVTGSNLFTRGPLRDVSIAAGFDLNTKNTAFAPEKRMFVVGPTLQFDVPGFWNVSLLFRTERNYNGIVGQSVHFSNTAMMETAWSIPFHLGGTPLHFEGFANVVAPKGQDGFGAQTRTEILLHPKVMLDVGHWLNLKARTLEAGVGWEYWYNKFGSDHHRVPGAIQSTAFVEAAVHF
ncbi:hypothetical protein [Pandoraea sp. NPDC090278]|uniref:hypothetical protein n=1 Tax=Pandoraea sp. NPDC090278 TaxID=3364391 RepID=UPI00383A6493